MDFSFVYMPVKRDGTSLKTTQRSITRMKKAAALGLSLALTASMTLPALAVEAVPISAVVGYDTAINNNGK